MTYALLAATFLAVATVAAGACALAARRRPHPAAVGITIGILLLLTAVFDTVMIGVGFFHYDAEHLLGPHVGLAPIEDFAYPLAGAVLLPVLWELLRARRDRSARQGTDAPR